MRNFEAWRSIIREASNVSMGLIKFFCCLHVTRTYLMDITYCPGASMLPTMNISGCGDVVLVDRVSPQLGKVLQGDIVIIRSPENPRKLITKRLIAMENDSLTFLVDPKNSGKSSCIVVPKGHVWVQGDNIYDSRDSRAFGSVPYDMIYGKVFWRIWPAEHFGAL